MLPLIQLNMVAITAISLTDSHYLLITIIIITIIIITIIIILLIIIMIIVIDKREGRCRS